MTDLLAYPFQLTPAGEIACVEDGSDESLAMELAVAVLTVQGERPLVPEFGCADPVFNGFDEDALRLHVGLFGPAVSIDAVTIDYIDDQTQEVNVRFDSDGGAVTSPDATPYVDLTLYDRDAQDIFGDALTNLQSYMPDWEPREGNVEVLLLESLAIIVEEQVFAINRIPGAVMEVLLRLFGVDRSAGTPPTADLMFTLSDDAGHTIPAGTRVALPMAGDTDPMVFTLAADVVVGQGELTGTGTSSADVNTAAANGTTVGTAVDLLDAITFIERVELASNVTGGTDQEDDIAWFNRGAERLTRLVETLVLPRHFTAASLEHPGVTRAFAVDSYNPAVGPSPGSNPGHITVAVYGLGGTVSGPDKVALQVDLAAAAQANLAIHVVDPTFTTVAITAAVLAVAGADPTAVQAACVAALTDYLSPALWQWGAKVYRNELIALLDGVDGVDRVETVTIPAADVTLAGVAPLAVAGSLAVTVDVP